MTPSHASVETLNILSSRSSLPAVLLRFPHKVAARLHKSSQPGPQLVVYITCFENHWPKMCLAAKWRCPCTQWMSHERLNCFRSSLVTLCSSCQRWVFNVWSVWILVAEVSSFDIVYPRSGFVSQWVCLFWAPLIHSSHGQISPSVSEWVRNAHSGDAL